jgi:hypothetical protein
MANRQQSVQFFNPNKPSFQESLRMKRVPIIAIAIFGTLPLIAYTGAARAYRSSHLKLRTTTKITIVFIVVGSLELTIPSAGRSFWNTYTNLDGTLYFFFL